MPVDLILRTRLKLLYRNLQEVTDVIDSVEEIGGGLNLVLATWAMDDRGKMPRPERLLRQIRAQVRFTAELNDDDRVARQLEMVMNDLDDVADKLYSAEMQRAVTDISRRSMKNLRESELGSFLAKSAHQHMDSIVKIEQRLDGLAEDADESVCAQVTHDAWEDYRKVLPKAQEVFAEYVDFLAGLALRHSGYDHGICRIADELIRAFGNHRDIGWNSLTVPARREALDVTMARIIRIGFPEWSIWALPLAAYGFGSLLVTSLSSQPPYKEFMQDIPDDRSVYARVLLTDAFATFVMGPAYACSLMLLRLDPATPESPYEPALTLLRAETVLRMLRRMATDAEQFYRGIEDRLREEWNAAVAQMQEETITPDIDISKLVRNVADDLWNKGLTDGALSRIDALSTAIGAGRKLEASQVDRVDDSLRTVLNAAWLARLRLAGDADLTELEATARGYWDVIEEALRQPSDQVPSDARSPIPTRR